MDRPIGIIDSGFGGLTVAQEIMRQLPKETICYIGDTLRCPYGPRPVDEVRKFTWQMINRLLEENVKMIVIACNTATAVVLEEARSLLSIPVVGVIQPGAISAIQSSNNQHIAVIGTTGTITSNAYATALVAISEQVTVESLACPFFVPLVEQGIIDGEEAERVVEESLKPLKNTDFDTLILGCTHYPLLKPVIESFLPASVTIISSGEETAREVSSLLFHHSINRKSSVEPEHQFFTTGVAESFKHFASKWLAIDTKNVASISLGSSLVFPTMNRQ
ncbi:glutamate racemase [Shouchella patagoniensis]|uniref:glutamate racemase n=1 Tax=Shouchella patagoniensis TaxID=228576 RepID=UPI000995D768|nr:glutamate racemase [Shouchella patagoniensis]